MSRIVKAKYAGITYEIPDIWIAGFCHGRGRTLLDAIRWWHEQAEMEKSWREQHA